MKNEKKKNSVVGAMTLYLSLIWVAYLVASYCAISPEEREFTLVGRLLSYMPQDILETLSLTQKEVPKITVHKPQSDEKIKKLLMNLEKNGIKPLQVSDLKSLYGNPATVPDGDIPTLTNAYQFYAFVDHCIQRGCDSADFYWAPSEASLDKLPKKMRVLPREWERKLPNAASLEKSARYYLTGCSINNKDNKDNKSRYNLSLFYSDFYRMLCAVNDTQTQWQWMRLTPEELEALHRLLSLVDEAILKKGMNREERSLAILNALVKRVKYHDLDDIESVFYKNRNKFVIYATQWEEGKKPGKAICEGYAQTYGFCLALVGIHSIPISGIVRRKEVESYLERTEKGDEPDPGCHAWNYVQMDDDVWYHVDPTWYDAENGKFNKKWFKQTHDQVYNANRAWVGCFPKNFPYSEQAPLPK